MINFIHGDDVTASRNYFFEQKNKNPDSISLDGKTLILSQLVQNLSGDGLFSNTKTIFIEDFFGRTASRDIAEIIDFLVANQDSADLYFWESKEIGKKNLSLFKNAKNNAFMLPKNLFLFLSSIAPGRKSMAMNFHKTLENIAAELIFFMLIRQWRLLLALSDSKNQQIDEIKRLAPWQKSKLRSQAGNFSKEQLKKGYQAIAEIEKNQKTGGSALSLEQALDIFLLSI